MAMGRGLAIVGILVAVSVACRDQQFGPGPLVFPPEARLGSTVVLSVDTNQTPFQLSPLQEFEDYALSSENVTIQIVDDVGPQILPVSAVVQGAALPSSPYSRVLPGGWFTVVAFSLVGLQFNPATLPKSVELKVLKDGSPIRFRSPGNLQWFVKILPGTGSHTNFFPDPRELEAPPMVRLRPRAGAANFDPVLEQAIGGLEFTFVFPTDKVANPAVFGMGEAFLATTAVGPQLPGTGTLASIRVVLMDPKGFELLLIDQSGNLGDGPLVDVALDRLGSFDGADFEIHDLRVVDVGGQVLIDRLGDATSMFTLIPSRNVVPGA